MPDVRAVAAARGMTSDFRSERAAMTNDPLPSWNPGVNKQAILDFVAAVTEEGGAHFVPMEERIATFDNDGTLWCEQPLYTQAVFAIDRIRALASDHPEWHGEQPFKAILTNDREALAKLSKQDIAAVITATHAGMTTDAFAQIVQDWIATATHPRFDRLYANCVYQPMVELLTYLRANGFQTWIVSGGGVDFMRVFAETVYGVPPAQVIGSSGKVQFELRDGQPVFVKLPELSSYDDKEGKPANIYLHVGRAPILAFGNSDGDQAMLEYTDSGDDPRLMLLVHHDDAAREYAYDRDSSIGKLDTALTAAVAKGWTVVGMKDSWRRVFPFSD
jgi:phosphoglycolate phosphatase-like HAD superfamily hydrolase